MKGPSETREKASTDDDALGPWPGMEVVAIVVDFALPAPAALGIGMSGDDKIRGGEAFDAVGNVDGVKGASGGFVVVTLCSEAVLPADEARSDEASLEMDCSQEDNEAELRVGPLAMVGESIDATVEAAGGRDITNVPLIMPDGDEVGNATASWLRVLVKMP